MGLFELLGALWGFSEAEKKAEKEWFEESKYEMQKYSLMFGFFDIADKMAKASNWKELHSSMKEYYYKTREKWLKEDMPEKEEEWRPVLEKFKNIPEDIDHKKFNREAHLILAELDGKFGDKKKYGFITIN
ncbi:hypothetical protein [Nitrosophilus labii]|uniref:hypothetical protein n=1 Tax=Nitrosophilus labii TaxID=2706014 RepID=UPI001656CDC5|nr:hypothetical protein [Nitrosophilus labii]